MSALILTATTLAAAACNASGNRDWMDSKDALAAPLWPADSAQVEQTPPDFSWPHRGTGWRYEIEITYPDGVTRRSSTPFNWILWPEVLPPGAYRWRVRTSTAGGPTEEGRLRHFTVAGGAVAFVVPDWQTLFELAQARPRPRALFPDHEAFLASVAMRRREGLSELLAEVENKIHSPVAPEPDSVSKNEIQNEVHDEEKRTQNAAFAYVVTGRAIYFEDALRRALNLASWNPLGSTGHVSQDESNRSVAWTLALCYDWLHERLGKEDRKLLLAAILPRVTAMVGQLLGGGGRFTLMPYDSHGYVALNKIAAISAILAGDLPEAKTWFRDAVPLALHSISPWGGEDGGFANGTAQAQWDTGESLIAWNILHWTTGVDIARKAWVRNYARYLAYFLPPGTPTGAFGDGAESRFNENWARYGKAYALFAPSPLARWYASRLSGEDSSRLDLLLAPPDEKGFAALPSGTPDAAWFPSIGWAAMHSELADRKRISVYFKSSPYGSFNHSHADQNSFVINAAGRPLAIDSGYYDDYDSPHWEGWYKQTIAHNAITFDGGRGQTINDKGARGSITRFEHHTEYDIVTGEAAGAYGNSLIRARRSLVYLHPNLVLVYDLLTAPDPHRWEWNIHALGKMNAAMHHRVVINGSGVALCVEMLAGPLADFAQTDRFRVPPRGADFPKQWHGAFVSRQRSSRAEFLMLLNVGCSDETVTVARADQEWTVLLSNSRVLIGEDRISVNRPIAHQG